MRNLFLVPLVALVLFGAGCSSSPEDVKHRSWFWKIADPWGTFVDEVKIPEDFPMVVPPYPQSTVQGANLATNVGQHHSILSLSSPDDVETINAWYRSRIQDAGWELNSESTSTEFSTQAWKKGEDRLVVSFTWISAQSQANISVVLSQPEK
mgnify:CR=1 FL=1